MKKMIAGLLLIALSLMITGCSSGDASAEEEIAVTTVEEAEGAADTDEASA